MSDIVALQTKLRSTFTYREFATDFGAESAPVHAQTGMLLSELFAMLEAPAPAPMALAA